MFEDILVTRVYVCKNRECNHKDTYSFIEFDDFPKKCPVCKIGPWIIQESWSNLATPMMDLNKPKTLGALADKNTDRIRKNGDPKKLEGFRKRYDD